MLLLFPLGLSTLVWAISEGMLLTSNINSMTDAYTEELKLGIKTRVNQVSLLVAEARESVQPRLRQMVQERSSYAWRLADSLYRSIGAHQSRSDLVRIVVESLRIHRQEQGRNGYFIMDLSGVDLLSPDNPAREGMNQLDTISADGRYIYREIVALARQKGEGFLNFQWPHPVRKGPSWPRITHIRIHKELGIIIGYGAFSVDMDEQVRQETLGTLRQIWYGPDGYVFVIDNRTSTMLLNNGTQSLVGQRVGELKDSRGNFIVRSILEQSRQSKGGGFVSYYWPRPSDGEDLGKISFVREIPEWEWVVGTGTYLETIDAATDSLASIFSTGFQVRIVLFLGLMGVAVAFGMGLAARVSLQVEESLRVFSDFFARAFRENVKIPLDEIPFSEFRTMGVLANQTVDIQRLVMDQLARKEKRYRSLFEASNDAILIHDVRGTVIEANQKARALFPVLGGSLEHPHLQDLMPDIGAGRISIFLRDIQELGASRMELETSEERAGKRQLELSSSLVEPGSTIIQTMVRDVSSARDARQRSELLAQDLARLIEVQSRVLEQTEHDLASARKELIRNEQMVTLGNLVSVFGHELATPLGIGITLSTLLDEQARTVQSQINEGSLSKSGMEAFLSTLRESADLLHHNLERAVGLMGNLKIIAVDQASSEERDFNLGDYLGRVVQSLEPQIRKTSHRMELSCPPDLVLHGNPGHWFQIISNLFNNSLAHAFEHTEAGLMRIEVRVENGELEMIYTDNGSGIPPEIRARVFEAYFTTKRGQGGSGLGLHIIRTLAEEMGATIDLDSGATMGVRFVLRKTLPA